MLMTMEKKRSNRLHRTLAGTAGKPARKVVPRHGAPPSEEDFSPTNHSPHSANSGDKITVPGRKMRYVGHPSFHASGASGKYVEFSPISFGSVVPNESFSIDANETEVSFVSNREVVLNEAFLHLNYRRWLISGLTENSRGISTTASEGRLKTLSREVEEVRNWIIEQNEPLVAILASRYQQYGVSRDELCSEAYTILVRAIDRFDVQRGVQFSTYASTAINRHLQRWLGKQARSRSQQESLNELELDPVSPQTPSATKDLQQEESIHAALKSLPEVLRQIVRLRFGLGDRGKSLSFRAIAERLGMSRGGTRTTAEFLGEFANLAECCSTGCSNPVFEAQF
jgi:RNA polymerase sigma factor (sigma-70 family)